MIELKFTLKFNLLNFVTFFQVIIFSPSTSMLFLNSLPDSNPIPNTGSMPDPTCIQFVIVDPCLGVESLSFASSSSSVPDDEYETTSFDSLSFNFLTFLLLCFPQKLHAFSNVLSVPLLLPKMVAIALLMTKIHHLFGVTNLWIAASWLISGLDMLQLLNRCTRSLCNCLLETFLVVVNVLGGILMRCNKK